MQWWDEAELTMSKLISTPPHPVAGAKISPHPYPTTFTGREKPTWGKAERGGVKLPSLLGDVHL